jgi:Fe-S cluster biogenesis protein NfuA/nitrite reductase/ring-hydroxylating ferredoxin subunit
MGDEANLRTVGARVEGLLEELASGADPAVRGRAEELVGSLVQLYGEALTRTVEVMRAAEGGRLLGQLAEDELVASLLILHGLHPLSTEARIERALESVRPYIGSHGGNVQLVALRDGVARLRLEGSCHGCPSSQVTMKLAVERAIEDAAPEVVGIEVEGQPDTGDALYQIGGAAGEWRELDASPALAPGELAPVEVDGAHLLLARIEQGLYAYLDACPACGALLGDAAVTGVALICPSCARKYDLQHAGRETTQGDQHLEPVPLLAANGVIKIALPARQPCRS